MGQDGRRADRHGATAALVGFRRALFGCLGAWADALFELCDALLCAPGPLRSVPALSLEPVFRRSHGSLYKARARGRVEADRLRKLLVEHRPTGWPLVFAVDASTWDRCDAETSPERGFYYSASKHSAGQPIVAGWSYQWVSQLDWAPDSWTAWLDVRRIAPGEDATTATVEQVRRLVGLLPADGGPSRCSSSTPDTTPSPSAPAWRTPGRRCWCASAPTVCSTPTPPRCRRGPGVGRAATRPPLRPVGAGQLDATGGGAHRRRPPLRHRAGPGLARSAPQARRPRPVGRRRRPADCARDRHPGRGRAPPQAHRPGRQDPVAVVVGARHPRPRRVLAGVLVNAAALRHRAHLPVRQEHAGLDDAVPAHPRAGGPLDVAGPRRLHATTARPGPRRRPPPAMGAPPRSRLPDPDAGAQGISSTWRSDRHAGQSTEIRDPRPRTPKRNTQRAAHPLPGGQEGRLRINRKLRTLSRALAGRDHALSLGRRG